jgi:hypothetical protein
MTVPKKPKPKEKGAKKQVNDNKKLSKVVEKPEKKSKYL